MKDKPLRFRLPRVWLHFFLRKLACRIVGEHDPKPRPAVTARSYGDGRWYTFNSRYCSGCAVGEARTRLATCEEIEEQTRL